MHHSTEIWRGPGGISGKRNLSTPRLDAAIEADPFDLNSWDARLREAIQDTGGRERRVFLRLRKLPLEEGKAEPVFERAVTQLPYAARIWAAYAEWSEMQARSCRG